MAGVKGGIAGGAAMIVPALLYGLIRYHSIWYAVNLLGGAGVAGWSNPTFAEITHFRLSALIFATIIHVVGSLLVGLLYGAMLPMLPRHPVILGGIIAPFLWTGVLHATLGLINPYPCCAHRLVVVCRLPGDLRPGGRMGRREASPHPYRAISALRRTRGIGNSRNDGRTIGRTDRSDGAPSDAGFLYDCAWLRTASWPSQAWTGSAESRVGAGLCYALPPELLWLVTAPRE